MNAPEPHQETPAAALIRHGNNYAAMEAEREERERVTSVPEIYRNRPPHTDERVFAILRAETNRWRCWAGADYNANAWMTESQTFTDEQRAWLERAAHLLEGMMDEMNKHLKEARS